MSTNVARASDPRERIVLPVFQVSDPENPLSRNIYPREQVETIGSFTFPQLRRSAKHPRRYHNLCWRDPRFENGNARSFTIRPYGSHCAEFLSVKCEVSPRRRRDRLRRRSMQMHHRLSDSIGELTHDNRTVSSRGQEIIL